ncbi:MAG: hypothetical protein MUC65_04105, partial [Pontiellaceae bacterium]|nr:hypothetical protein [Pontiellaceae bacterium]
WYSRLQELQSQLTVYDEKTAVTAVLLKLITSTANDNGLNLLRTIPGKNAQTGNLYELGITCKWEGSLSSLTRFLYDLQKQGVRFDVLQLTATPDAQRNRILNGSMTIDCAYRIEKKGTGKANPPKKTPAEETPAAPDTAQEPGPESELLSE